MSKYTDLVALITQHLTEAQALIAQLPDPISDLQVIDTSITAMIGTLSAKVGAPPST
jgi:hypothetical protein